MSSVCLINQQRKQHIQRIFAIQKTREAAIFFSAGLCVPLYCCARFFVMPLCFASELGGKSASENMSQNAMFARRRLERPNFARTFSGTDTLAIYRQAIRQFDDYKGYYPYYYYFGHPEKDETDLQEQEKGGIN